MFSTSTLPFPGWVIATAVVGAFCDAVLRYVVLRQGPVADGMTFIPRHQRPAIRNDDRVLRSVMRLLPASQSRKRHRLAQYAPSSRARPTCLV